MDKIAIIGRGGSANYVSEIIESTGKYEVSGFIGKKDDPMSDYHDKEFEELKSDGIKFLANGVGNLSINNNIIIDLLGSYVQKGFAFPVIIHPSSVVSISSSIGLGTVITENAVIKSNAIIGQFCVMNSLSVVSHECEVGDHVHLSLGAKIGGNSRIGDNVLLGINSSVNQNIKIGSDSIVGSGAVVINDQLSNRVIVGNPGKAIKVL